MPDGLLGNARTRQRLAGLRSRSLNFRPADLKAADPGCGWQITDLCQPLARERPGPPARDGAWEIARKLMEGYEFADPSIVRAYYDPAEPLEHRTMLLELKALAVLRLWVGVRIGGAYDRAVERDGRPVRIWGWSYSTLEGHVEEGQMDWEVWKWLDSGEVEFRVHSVSRPAPISNPLIRIGFHLLRGHERRTFLDSTKRRMHEFTQLALQRDDPSGAIREAAPELTARPSSDRDAAHDALAGKLRG